MDAKEICLSHLSKVEKVIDELPPLASLTIADLITRSFPERSADKKDLFRMFISFYLYQRNDLVVWHYGDSSLKEVHSIKKKEINT